MCVSDDEVLEIDGVVDEASALPVPPPYRARHVTHRRGMPVVAQAAAVAATGFAAGAVAAALVRAARNRRALPARRRPAQLGPRIVATRSFLIDVHVLEPRA